MRLITYKAKCGDAFHLQYVGNSGKCRNIFLDMGYSKTYTSVLKINILSLLDSAEKIDALFLSHIHDDHIGGVTQFIKDIKTNPNLNDIVGHWFYNPPRKYEVSVLDDKKNGVPCGIVSGDTVYDYILACHSSDIDDYTSGKSYDIDGMKVTILSPNKDKLQLLRDKYSNNRPLCKSEVDEVTVEASCVTDDYSTRLEDFNTESFQEDSSIENSSSLAAIFDINGKRILWLADSVPSVVMDTLVKMGFSETNKLHCDVVLTSHHGSSANNSTALFRMISANKYVFSVDGINRYNLPNKETVARILSASTITPVTLYFNYNDGRIQRIFNCERQEELKSIITIKYLNQSEAIEL